MGVLKWILIGVGVVILIAAVFIVLGLLYSMYLSMPYDEWVEIEKERDKRKLEKKEKRGWRHGKNNSR